MIRLLRGLSVPKRRDADPLAKGCREVGARGESAFERDFRSRLVRVTKKPAGFLDADTDKVFAGREPGLLLEESTELRLRQARLSRQIGNRELLAISSIHQFYDTLHVETSRDAIHGDLDVQERPDERVRDEGPECS